MTTKSLIINELAIFLFSEFLLDFPKRRIQDYIVKYRFTGIRNFYHRIELVA